MADGQFFSRSNFDPDWVIGLFAHLLKWIEKFRNNTTWIGAEHAIEVEFRVRNVCINLDWNDWYSERRDKDFILSDVVFPTYTFGVNNDIDRLLNLFRRDLFNSVGRDVHEEDVCFTFKKLNG